MKTITQLLATLLLATLPVLASAQLPPQRMELVTVEHEIDSFSVERLEVFRLPQDGANHYYLTVGHLGFGDDVIQVMIDPLFELFIPLGDTVAEALASMQNIQQLLDEAPGTSIEVEGCLAFGVPNDQLEPVKVTLLRPLLSKILEFSIQRGEYMRAAHLSKSDFNTLVRGVKFYQKIHPKEP